MFNTKIHHFIHKPIYVNLEIRRSNMIRNPNEFGQIYNSRIYLNLYFQSNNITITTKHTDDEYKNNNIHFNGHSDHGNNKQQ